MRRGWLRVLIGIVLFAAAIVALAPATLIDVALASRSGDRLRLVDASGLWWDGRGLVATADGSARLPVAWRVDLSSPVRGELSIRLAGAHDASPMGTITLTNGRVEVARLHLRIPAGFAGSVDPRLQTVALGGSVTVDSPAVAFDSGMRSGSLRASWERARVAAGNVVAALGTVVLDVAVTGDHLSGTIGNAGGELAIDGTLRERAGAFEVDLALRPTEATPESVQRALPLLGAPDASGGVRLAWRGNR